MGWKTVTGPTHTRQEGTAQNVDARKQGWRGIISESVWRSSLKHLIFFSFLPIICFHLPFTLIDLRSFAESYFAATPLSCIVSQGVNGNPPGFGTICRHKLHFSNLAPKPSQILSNSDLSIYLIRLPLNQLKKKEEFALKLILSILR